MKWLLMLSLMLLLAVSVNAGNGWHTGAPDQTVTFGDKVVHPEVPVTEITPPKSFDPPMPIGLKPCRKFSQYCRGHEDCCGSEHYLGDKGFRCVNDGRDSDLPAPWHGRCMWVEGVPRVHA